jgi:VanZ family protein
MANVLLYVPFGLFAPSSLALPVGPLLSIALEAAQIYVPGRDPNIWDVAANSLGTALGIAARQLARRIRWEVHDVGALVVAAGWPLSRVIPLQPPALRVDVWKAALQPLISGGVSPLDAFHHAVLWLAFARLATAATGVRWIALPAFVLVEIGRVAAGRFIGWSEILGAAVAMVVLPFWRSTALLAVLAGAAIAVEELRPFIWSDGSAPFNWMPFHGFLHGSVETNVISMLQKSFAYGAAIWLAWRAGLPLAAASVGCALALLALEALQTHIPARHPEVSDALIALTLGAALAALSPRGR